MFTSDHQPKRRHRSQNVCRFRPILLPTNISKITQIRTKAPRYRQRMEQSPAPTYFAQESREKDKNQESTEWAMISNLVDGIKNSQACEEAYAGHADVLKPQRLVLNLPSFYMDVI